MSRDPLGLWGDPGQLGNPYSFAGSDPVNGVDPFGDRYQVNPELRQQLEETIENLNDARDLIWETYWKRSGANPWSSDPKDLEFEDWTYAADSSIQDTVNEIEDYLSGAEHHDPPTPAPRNVIGTVDYYRWRHWDFKLRHQGCGHQSPPYYLEYGDKYAWAFTSNAKHFSFDGRTWIDNARLLLQVYLELEILSNPGIETTPDGVKGAGYSIHPRAYGEAGIRWLNDEDLGRAFRLIDEWLDPGTYVQSFYTIPYFLSGSDLPELPEVPESFDPEGALIPPPWKDKGVPFHDLNWRRKYGRKW